ncbi:MAG: Fe2+-dependent dioxygenase [Pseudomonadota bacterium]
MLMTIEALLSRDEVAQCRARLDRADWIDGAATAGGFARSVKANQQLADDSEAATSLSRHVLARLNAHPLVISAALPRRIYPPRFNRYADGGTYGAHVDSALMRIPGSEAMLRSDLSVTLFLTDPAEYDGGELEIEGSFGAQPVKLRAGDAILYPASSLHRVTPVTRGARIAAFCWIESLVRDDGERDLLFDLDQSIQRLTALHGETEETRGLAGLYHNLLRRWTTT